MYMIPDMLEMGLKPGQKWPSDAHRVVAMKLCLCNPLVDHMDALIDLIQKINSIPEDKIKTVTLNELGNFGIYLYGA